MKISTSVAYRIYNLQPQTKAIAFHIQRRQFMFLDGLSAQLLQLILDDDQQALSQWMQENQLSGQDVHQFKLRLSEFGFWENQDSATIVQTAQNVPAADDENPESKKALNLFMRTLHKNGLFYSFHLDLTNRCNEKCIHCYHPFDRYDYSKELRLEEIKELVDIIYELGVFSVTLSGGECLLHKNFFEVLSYISDKGMLAVVFTNGMLLTEETVQKLLNYRVKLVSISLYGDSPEVHDKITTIPGSFHRTMAGIQLLKKYNIRFELKCVVLAENIHRAEAMRKLSMELNNGADCKLDFSLCGKLDGDCQVFSHRASSEAIREIFYSDPERYFGASEVRKRSPDEVPCGAGKYGLYCTPDGSVYPCVSFRLFLCHYRDLPNITQNPVLRQWLQTRIGDFSDCLRHDYCDYCNEQCAGNNMIENGDYRNSAGISNCERAKIIAQWFAERKEGKENG